MAGGPLGRLQAQTLDQQGPPSAAEGYGPLVPKGEFALPAEFNVQPVQRQFMLQRDGTPAPGNMDGMGAFPDAGGPQNAEEGTTTENTDATNPPGDTTILIRNHENRTSRGGLPGAPGQVPVVVPPGFRYDEDPSYIGGCSKLVVRQTRSRDEQGQEIRTYELVDSFNILGGTDANCAGGELPFKKWITCEEQVNRSPVSGKKHGYCFEVDAMSDGPVQALPILAAGRFQHEAVAWNQAILYQTEDRRIRNDGGSCFYRYIPDQRVGQSGNLAETTGRLEALAIKGEPRANTDERPVGVPFEVEWVPVPEPDHDDDTDQNRTGEDRLLPTRFQAQNRGAAIFDRTEGIWVGSSNGAGSKIYFDCTEGGTQNLGQVFEYDPGRETLTLIYVSRDRNTLENPDNVTIVPKTGDIFLCEDSPGEQFIRGVTRDGEIYNFAQLLAGDSELAGACFDPDGQTLYVNRFGERGPEDGLPSDQFGTTYAIYGPFEKRAGANNQNFGNGPAVNSGNGSGNSGNRSRS